MARQGDGYPDVVVRKTPDGDMACKVKNGTVLKVDQSYKIGNDYQVEYYYYDQAQNQWQTKIGWVKGWNMCAKPNSKSCYQ